jgi:hypothetical protein
LASNKHLKNTIRASSPSSRKKGSEGKENNGGIQIRPKWELHERSFSEPVVKGVTTIYKRNRDKLVIGFDE